MNKEQLIEKFINKFSLDENDIEHLVNKSFKMGQIDAIEMVGELEGREETKEHYLSLIEE